MIHVYAVPKDEPSFLMFIAEMGEEYAHRNVRITRRHYLQHFTTYEFRDGAGIRRFELLEV